MSDYILTAESEKREEEILDMIEDKLNGEKVQFCRVVVPNKPSGRWEISGMVIIDGKDFDFIAIYQENMFKNLNDPS